MWKSICFSVITCSVLAVGLRPADAATGSRAAAKALAWQARQYTHIQTIHFKASGQFVNNTVNGPLKGTISYEYWGSGPKYRIVFKQSEAGADYNQVIADNGKHLYVLDKITGHLMVRRSKSAADYCTLENPVLEPLAPLAPPVAQHPRMWNLWMNLPRFFTAPQSVFSRCMAVKDCGPSAKDGAIQGCLLGSSVMQTGQVKFTLRQKPSWPHALVTGWQVAMLTPGRRARLSHIVYQSFTINSHHTIFLPVAFKLKGRSQSGYFQGRDVARTRITHIAVNKPIPSGIFRINYKLARFVTVVKHGKYITFDVKPKQGANGWPHQAGH